jgi:hypothetical protein
MLVLLTGLTSTQESSFEKVAEDKDSTGIGRSVTGTSASLLHQFGKPAQEVNVHLSIRWSKVLV